MGSLMSLRSELLRGDLRCLYLGWLLCVQHEEFAGEELEPPVPAGLGEFSAPLHSLIEFLGIDEELVEVAALTSAPLNAGPSRKELDAWIRSLPEKEKSDLLLTAASPSGDRWRNDLLRRFRQQNEQRALPACRQVQRRTAGDLLAAVHAWRRREPGYRTQNERRKQSDRKQKPRQTADGIWTNWRSAKKRRGIRLQRTSKNGSRTNTTRRSACWLTCMIWRSARQSAEFQSALEKLRQTHAAKESFLRRLTKAKL